VPLVSLERTLQVSIEEDRKSRSSDCFSVLADLNSYRFDLTFSYDVISICMFCLFFYNNKKKEKKEKRKKWGYFGENLQDFFFLAYYILYVSLPDISIL
jgi:hypothetical protein